MDCSFLDWFANLFLGGSTSVPIEPLPTTEANALKFPSPPNTKLFLEMLTSQMATAAAKIHAKNQNGPKRMSYENYQIWRLAPSTTGHVEFLREYKESDYKEHIMWLKGPSMRYSKCFDLHSH